MQPADTIKRITALEAGQHPDRYLVIWPEDNTTSTQIATWRASNPRGTVIRVQYSEGRYVTS